MDITSKIASELNVKPQQVLAAITLLDEGATVPFISRYRKEVTGALSDTQLRLLEERLIYLRELNDRRQVVLKSIHEQGKMTPELETALLAVEDKATLEDLYLPFKPKRRTKAQIAREAGLEPLAMGLLNNPMLTPEVFAQEFIDAEKGVPGISEALEGARHILMEYFAETPALLGELREFLWVHALLKSEVMKGKENAGNKFADYFNYQEALTTIPSHRALAVFRGQREEVLRLELFLDEAYTHTAINKILSQFALRIENKPADAWLMETVQWTWKIKLFLKLELELMMRMREAAEEEAIRVFANNLKHLLMASPAGSRLTLGMDPGLRTGVKLVVIDETGKLLHYMTIFPHAPRNEWKQSIGIVAELCKQFKIELVSIGNGTASRETDKLITEVKKAHPELKLTSIVISEAGASVYSASEVAANEFPELDVSYRGAVSIARRLQDPLAELVKIEPKSIGVGQYQHDVNQVKLSRSLHAVMEDCVNAVGVDVNTASIPLLACVAGLNQSVASNIVQYRNSNGAFQNRQSLKLVPRLGEKAFQQCAGFLRINNGENPLDASAVHPEAYSLVEKILADQKKSMHEIMGNKTILTTLNPMRYIDDNFGLPTVTDILKELEKPGRDPRPEFKMATFKEGIETLNDLHPGMVLEGVITNVTNFGAFVDIGVHQDGLVHKSLLANHFVKDPNEVVKVGQIVKVKVMEVDMARKRIQLSMRLQEEAKAQTANKPKKQSNNKLPPSNFQPTLGSALLQAMSKPERK